MPLKGNKKKQEAIRRKEIAKKKKLQNEPDLDCPSGSEENYDIDSSDNSLVVTTRSKEGGVGTEFDSEDPPMDDEEDGDNKVYEFRDDGSVVE
ncbi:hypothetical protein HAX54_017207, partial [Datura stramonium]|nr:hypothetical protein [Datura stramonium]